MTIEIKTIYDLLEYAKEHPNYQYTYYDGEWLVYPDNSSSYLKDIEINYKMMRVLEDWNKVLDFECYTISHRAVRNYRIPQESGGYIISDEYYRKEKEALDKAYSDIIERKKNES